MISDLDPREQVRMAERIAVVFHGATGAAYGDDGSLYIVHPRQVVDSLSTDLEWHTLSAEEGDICRQVAWLHDTLEDTALIANDLDRLGFDSRVITDVDTLTRRMREPRSAYIARTGATKRTRVVKRTDLGCNYRGLPLLWQTERARAERLRTQYETDMAYLNKITDDDDD